MARLELGRDPDPSGLWRALEEQVGATTLWEWTKEWVEFTEVDWDERERMPLAQFLYERAGMDAEEGDREFLARALEKKGGP